MKLRLYASLAEAERAQQALDAAAGVPRAHAEGDGPDDYRICTPGNAAARIRARGVRTEHLVELLTNEAGTAFGLRAEEDDPDASELEPATWHGPTTRETRP